MSLRPCLFLSLTLFTSFQVLALEQTSKSHEYPVKVTATSFDPNTEKKALDWLAIRSWRLHKSIFPSWNATVTQMDVPGPGRGGVAVCGDSGFVAYLSRYDVDISDFLNITLGLVDLRQGRGTLLSTKIPLSDIELQNISRFDDSESRTYQIACASDAQNLSLELLSSGSYVHARAIFHMDILQKKMTKVGDVIESKHVYIENPLVNFALRGIVIPSESKDANSSLQLQRIDAVSLLETWLFHPPYKARLRMVANSSGLWAYPIEGENIHHKKTRKIRKFAVAYWGAEQRKVAVCFLELGDADYLQMLDEDLVRVSRTNLKTKNRTLEAVDRPLSDGQKCKFREISNIRKYQSPAMHHEYLSQYGGSRSELVQLSYLPPSIPNINVPLHLALYRADEEPLFYSLLMSFKGINEEEGDLPWIWTVPGTGPLNSTFAYGPIGRGTTMVHLWKN